MGEVIDTLFGGGQQKAYRDLARNIQRGTQERRQGEYGAESALSPFYSQSTSMQGAPASPFSPEQQMALERMPSWIRDSIMKHYQSQSQGQPQYPSQGGSPLALDEYYSETEKMRDPSAYLSQLLSSYSESPMAKHQRESGINAINASAAASGMLGSGATQEHAAQLAEDISNRDMQNYLNNLLGIRDRYMGGIGNLEQQGFITAQDIAHMRNLLGQDIAGDYGDIGRTQYGADIAQSNAIRKLLGTAAGAALGGYNLIPGLPEDLSSGQRALMGGAFGMGF